jgi:serine protease
MLFLSVLLGCGGERAPVEKPVFVAARSSIGPAGPPASVVDCNGGGDFTTIQAAIDAAPREGWIQVAPCTYHDTLDFGGRSLWIGSTGGSAVTTLDADNGVAVLVDKGETDDTALVGFTITDASTAATIRHASLRLQDVVIRNSGSTYVIDGEGADLELDGVVIDGSNDAFTAALYMDRGGLAMIRSHVDCGNAGVAVELGHGAAHIDGSTLTCPGSNDAALETENEIGRIHRSVLDGRVIMVQEETHPEDKIAFENTRFTDDVEQTWGTIFVKNSVMVNGTFTLTDIDPSAEFVSTVFQGGGCAIGTTADIVVRNNDFFQTASRCGGLGDYVGSDGNLAVNPLFVDPAGGDWTLQVGSPLVDAGPTDTWYQDVDGSRNDVGLTGGKYSILGGW